jgi:hypothetical protein
MQIKTKIIILTPFNTSKITVHKNPLSSPNFINVACGQKYGHDFPIMLSLYDLIT